MYNHARTLLLNRDGTDAVTIGDELVPRDYRATNLSNEVQQVRRVLFGSDPDRAMLNYRLAQLMPLLHATPLVEFVLELDPRITYPGPGVKALFLPATFVPRATLLSGTGSLYFQGEPVAPDVTGRLRCLYQVETTASVATVVVKQQAPRAWQQIQTPTLQDGLFTDVTLGDSGYSSMVTQTTGVWEVEVYNRPTLTLGEIDAALHQVGDPTLVALFGTARVEPYLTFKNLFYQHDELPYRLGGLLLAVVWRTEEARRRT